MEVKSIFENLFKKNGENGDSGYAPKFLIKKPGVPVEFPKKIDIRNVNIIYPLIEPFAYANIKWNPDFKELVYNLIEPELDENDEEILKNVSQGIIELVDVELTSIRNPTNAVEYLEKNFIKVLKEFGLKLTPEQYPKIMYYIYRDFIGYNEIEPLMRDPTIEDISCDGIGTPIYIIHRKFGSLKTSIVFRDPEVLREFVVKLAERSGRYVSYAEPILDGTLTDGSRVSATIAGDVATRGPVFTIRKFGEKPFSPIELVELGTVSIDILAYLWYLVEHGASMLLVGGTATGKTSLLNSVCMFIPPEAKIVSIEDTREIRIPHEHWSPGLARTGFGMPLSTGEKYGGISLFDLLKESFRQNPDYVIVGETRGAEASVMFQGMSSGHVCLSTFHAGSLDTLVKRLITPPIELAPTLVESLDVVILMIHAREKGKSARRVKEVIEIEAVDSKTNEVRTKKIFMWNPAKDTFERVEDSIKLGKFAVEIGGSLEEAMQDIENRRRVLEWMKENKIRDYKEVAKYINLYYKEPEKLLKLIERPFSAEVKIERPHEKKSRFSSIFEMLGFKVVKEK
ncbi:MAG TPA: type II/IV secretion system ATPase subunit [archaeon]|nr:type II/IV secretion system ATPase subunit [archaeon]